MLPPLRRVKACLHKSSKCRVHSSTDQFLATSPSAIKPPVLRSVNPRRLPQMADIWKTEPCAHYQIEETLYIQAATHGFLDLS